MVGECIRLQDLGRGVVQPDGLDVERGKDDEIGAERGPVLDSAGPIEMLTAKKCRNFGAARLLELGGSGLVGPHAHRVAKVGWHHGLGGLARSDNGDVTELQKAIAGLLQGKGAQGRVVCCDLPAILRACARGVVSCQWPLKVWPIMFYHTHAFMRWVKRGTRGDVFFRH